MIFNENLSVLFRILLKHVPKSHIDNKQAPVQIMIGAKTTTSYYLNRWCSTSIYASLSLE